MGRGRLLALRDYPCIDLVELDLVDLLALDQVGFAGFVDLDLLQHLADNHFNVLVIDAHALDRQNIVRRRITLDDEVALLDHIAFLQVDVLAFGNEIFPGLLILVGRFDADATFVFVVAAEAHGAGDFRNHRGFLRPARFEQLRHPRQTAGDIARLGAFGRNTRDDVRCLHMRTWINRNDRVYRQHVAGFAATAKLEDLLVLALDYEGGAQILLAARRARAPIDDDALGNAGGLIERLGHGLTFDQILEADRSLNFGEDRTGIRIPLGNALTALDVIAIVDLKPRAIRNAVHRAFGPIRIEHCHDQVAVHRDQIAVRIAGDVHVLDSDRSFKVGFDEGLLRNLRCAADMEGAHGELGARFADRLCSDNTDRLAHIHRRATGEIAPIAFAADPIYRVAGQHRTNAHFLHTRALEPLHLRLLQQRSLGNENFVA